MRGGRRGRLTEPLWDQCAAPLPQRSEFDPAHPSARSFWLRRRTAGVRQGVFGCRDGTYDDLVAQRSQALAMVPSRQG